MSGRGGRGGGRGAYYKARYGGGARGDRGGGNTFQTSSNGSSNGSHLPPDVSDLGWDERLLLTLTAIDGQQYGQYKRLIGEHRHQNPNFFLIVDHVQGDAYAPPSRIRVWTSVSETGLPSRLLTSPLRRIAVADYITRIAASVIREKRYDEGAESAGWSGPKGGVFRINGPGQAVLPRTSCVIGDAVQNPMIELRFTVSLPAQGRTILGSQARAILTRYVLEVVKMAILAENLDIPALNKHVVTVLCQQDLRAQLETKGLTAFVADTSILPRVSGASDLPLRNTRVVPFKSPAELSVKLELFDDGLRNEFKDVFDVLSHDKIYGKQTIEGMGVPRGVTVLTGGGFHGKSTLLEALQVGIYNHVPDDGREWVVTDPHAIKIRAEDGRSVTGVDISPFIAGLPNGMQTTAFHTADASGSTSMAASIQEALEFDIGATTLLIDEDTSATNLLVRDERMQQLIRNEPITPLISRARELYESHGVNTILVVGGLGDWLSVADTVIGMDSYLPHSLTAEAKHIARHSPAKIPPCEAYSFGTLARNIVLPKRVTTHRRGPLARTMHTITGENDFELDLSGIEQLIEHGQSRTIAALLPGFASSVIPGDTHSWKHLGRLAQEFEGQELYEWDKQDERKLGDLVGLRRFEIAAAISRVRGAQAEMAH